MPEDSETFEEDIVHEISDSDFPSMGVDLLKRINFRVAFFLLLLSSFLLSDIFVDNLLKPGVHQFAGVPNTAGTTIQIVVLVIGYIIIDLLVQAGVL